LPSRLHRNSRLHEPLQLFAKFRADFSLSIVANWHIPVVWDGGEDERSRASASVKRSM